MTNKLNFSRKGAEAQRTEIGRRRTEDTPVEFPWGNPIQLGRDYTDYTDEKTREEEVNGSSFTRINHQRITNNDAHRYAGGVPDEETIIYDGPDISWQEEWKEFTSAIRENREPMGSGRDGMEANRMIEAVYRSVAENRPVRIDEK